MVYSGNKNQQGLDVPFRVPRTLLVLCVAMALFGMMIFPPDSNSICTIGENDDNTNCSNDTVIHNPLQSNSTGQEASWIALGCGIGIGIPTFVAAVWGIVRCKRKGRLC
jgi:hypothetical protein